MMCLLAERNNPCQLNDNLCFTVCGWNPKVSQSNKSYCANFFPVVLLFSVFCEVAPSYESVDEIQQGYQSNESY